MKETCDKILNKIVTCILPHAAIKNSKEQMNEREVLS